MAKFSATQHRALMGIFNKRLIAAVKNLHEASTQERNQRAPALNTELEKIRVQFTKKARILLDTKKGGEVLDITLMGPGSPKRYQTASSPQFSFSAKFDSDFQDILEAYNVEVDKVFDKYGGKVEQIIIEAMIDGYAKQEYLELLPKDAKFVRNLLSKRDAFDMDLVVSGTDIDLESMLQNLGI